MMIRKTLTVTIALILLWSIIVNFLPQDLDTYQSQRDNNLIRAQDYLYSVPNIQEENVILGTSLSQKISESLLSKNFYNLAFGGQGIFDGLDVVNYPKEKPRVVFIEINNILKVEGDLFTEALFGPATYNLKKYVPLLRDRNKPVGVLRGFTRPRQKTAVNFKMAEDQIDETDAYKAVLNQQREAYKTKPSKQRLDPLFQRLKQSVEKLEKEGTTVVFFEMPVHQELCTMPRATTIRKRFYVEFPQKQYLYIKQPNCGNYQTTDGIHLTEASGNRYSLYFKRKAAALPL
ncbi:MULTISPECIES: hypothetical protein [unclassified Leptolyngbya]|uniref:hypothetical protein n=1 Tax=unclassified Leptolyngbya TaxID=2650499 RepID=UPI0016861AAD|nr:MULTISPECIES: hypothetical protein [unclassified Leptolyngbya]MBD1912328.1 hypothetical protein [Leptolyngbya sp. FACHB-8]MBD2158036.1 hypothetical protein [Leptolyngbya sp. FACHB-16]